MTNYQIDRAVESAVRAVKDAAEPTAEHVKTAIGEYAKASVKWQEAFERLIDAKIALTTSSNDAKIKAHAEAKKAYAQANKAWMPAFRSVLEAQVSQLRKTTCAECGASLAAAVSIAMDARAAGVVDRLERPQPSFARANGAPGAPGRCVR